MSLTVSREQILAYRLRAGSLTDRLPAGADSLRAAAVAGLQDSMPRAALLSINARMADTPTDLLDDPGLIQTWGPGYSVYVVAADDLPVFTLGRFPDDTKGQDRATGLAARIAGHLGGRSLPFGEVGRALGVHHNALRYATTTGTVVIRWDGARQPTITTVAAPGMDRSDARLELARRHLRAVGPSTPSSFGSWAGVRLKSAVRTFELLADELTAVDTPIGEAWILDRDVEAVRAAADEDTPRDRSVRLLPSGDVYFLMWGADRALLVPDACHRDLLWTPRVWPGAILADGEIVGTWRRAGHRVTLSSWIELGAGTQDRIVAEAEALPLPGVDREIETIWDRMPT